MHIIGQCNARVGNTTREPARESPSATSLLASDRSSSSKSMTDQSRLAPRRGRRHPSPSTARTRARCSRSPFTVITPDQGTVIPTQAIRAGCVHLIARASLFSAGHTGRDRQAPPAIPPTPPEHLAPANPFQVDPAIAPRSSRAILRPARATRCSLGPFAGLRQPKGAAWPTP
jgi:hypothetical protein